MSLPPSYNLLAEYPNPVYIETGIWRGDSIQQAIDVGFKRVIGIDNDPSCIEFCRSRFDKNPAIELHSGDSVECLSDIIRTIQEAVTFLFDAHWQFLEGTEPGANPFPLLKEIDTIRLREQPDIVIIDDWHIFYKDRVGYGKAEVLFELEMAGFIKFQYVANPVIDGILIAQR